MTTAKFDRLMKAWEKADQRARLDFLSYLDQWQAMRREELELAKANAAKLRAVSNG